jgi:hypothetical protein
VSDGDARFLYAVRCNFRGSAAEEAAWNAWYDGPKRAQMLRLPMFLSLQRLVACALDQRRKYLALWVVASPEAFLTPEYRAQWGFADWEAKIADWSRDLYRAPASIDAIVDLAAGDALYVASFDGMTPEAAELLLGARRGDTLWLDAVGLDRHAPIMGLRRIARGAAPPAPAAIPGLNETLFERLSPSPRDGVAWEESPGKRSQR